MKKTILLLTIPFIFACGNKSIEDLDFNTMYDPCEVVNAADIITKRMVNLFDEYGHIEDLEDLPKKIQIEIEMIKEKMEDLEDIIDDRDWNEDDLQDCPKFDDVDKRFRKYNF